MEKSKRKNDHSSGNPTGAYILIGLGVVFLLMNVLNFSWGQLWPLILIGIGLYLLVGRNAATGARTEYFNEPLGTATSADIDLKLSVGEATVSASNDAGQLIDAEITYVGDVVFEVSGDDQKHIRLSQTGESGLQWINPANWSKKPNYSWNVALSEQVPMNLNIQGGVGEAKIDLRRLQLTDLRLHGGLGKIDARLPEAPDGYDVDLHGGVGEVKVDLPPSTDLNLHVQGGIGEITLSTPANAGIRVEARGGISNVNVPASMKRLERGGEFDMGNSGVWESPNFENAAHRIVIDYRGGVGELKVR